MSKKILLINFMLVTSFLSAQIFSENFNSGMPTSFTTYDLDGLTADPNLPCPFTGSFVVCSYNGEIFAASPSQFSPSAGTANDWMITPAITLPTNTNPKELRFDASAGNATYADGVEVYVSTTGNSPSDFNTTAIYNSTLAGEPISWTTRSIDISAYSGQTIYIAFRNHSFNKVVLGIDNIEVVELDGNDAELTSLTFPQYSIIPSNISIEGIVTNVGGNNISSLDLVWSDGTNSYTENLTVNINPGFTYSFIHSTPLNFNISSSTNVTVTIDNVNGLIDPNMSDNTLSKTITSVPFIPTKRVVFEESGGTWCPFCPEGVVALEVLEQNFPLTAIGIAVHNNDIMMNSTYDNGLNMSTWPSARIDRSIEANGTSAVNEQSFIQYYNERINTFSPVEISGNAIFNPNSRNITITLSGEFAINLSGDIRFNAIIIENGVGPYNQANNFTNWNPPLIAPISGINFSASPNPVNMLFDNVARGILGGYNGTSGSLPSTINAEDVFDYEYNYTLPNNQNENNIKIVGIVIDNNTGEILNGVRFDMQFGTTEISEINRNSDLFIFPNPAENIINISSEYQSIKIYNLIGELVFNDNAQKSINLKHLKNGIYSAKIYTKAGIHNEKFILER